MRRSILVGISASIHLDAGFVKLKLCGTLMTVVTESRGILRLSLFLFDTAQIKKKSPGSKKSSPRPAPIVTKGSALTKSGKKEDKSSRSQEVKSAVSAPASVRLASTRSHKEPLPPAGIFSDDLLGGGISPGLAMASPWMNDLLGPPSTTRSATRAGGGLMSTMLLTNRSTPGSRGSGRAPKHLGEDNEPSRSASRSASRQPSSARGSGSASTRSRAGAGVPNSGHVPNSAVGGMGTFDLEFASGGTGLTPSMFSTNSPMLQTPTFGALDDMVGGFFGDEPLSTRGRRWA